ncbi:MAG: hypothetical protein H7A35_05405 [Planctomycetales bacterium]|nr:hypothetical protein [bacterium]UNM09494.1 MAG: hypothetical protein H7A35_05405 [Planctomycetales bacterium]
MYRLITLLQASLLAIMLAACGAAGPGPEQSAGAKEFSLRVLPESFAMGGSAEFRMSVERDAERAIVSIEAANAKALSHAYLEIAYDSSQWTAGEADSAGLLGSEAIHLLAGNGGGRVQYGELQPGADPPGVDGSGLLATIEFRRGAEVRRKPSAVADAQPQLSRNARWSILSWYYTNPGDYDQNGEVNIADLTPLGINLGRSGPFSEGQMEYMVDGDGNGEINVSDITPIAVHFGNLVEGYTLYAGVEGQGYPSEATAANGAGTRNVVSLALADIDNSPAERKQFRHTDLSPAFADRYWVRAGSSAGEGPAGNLTQEWEKQWHLTEIEHYDASWSVTEPRLEIIDNRPAAAWSAGNGDRRLYYCRSVDRAGLLWEPKVELPGTYTDAWQPELGVVDNRPAISVPVDVGQTCYYTIGADGDGSSWSPMVKSSVSNEDQFAMMEIAGRPLVFGHNGMTTLYFYLGDAPAATLFTELGYTTKLQMGSLLQQGDSFLAFYRDSQDSLAYVRRYNWDGNDLPAEQAIQLGAASTNVRPGGICEYGGQVIGLAAYDASNMLQQYESSDLSGGNWDAPVDLSVSQPGQFAPELLAAYGGLMATWTDVNAMQVASAFSADGSAAGYVLTGPVIEQIPVVELKEMRLLGPHPCMAFTVESGGIKFVNFYVFY